MSMIMCPECGAPISSRARTCMECGYVGDDPARSISEQISHEVVPTFKMAVERWDPMSEHDEIDLVDIAPEDNAGIRSVLGNWKQVVTLVPALAEWVQQQATQESDRRWVADIPEYYRHLIEEGKIVLKEAKDGSGILPTAYYKDGGFAKQFRLKEVDLSPDTLQSLQHLQTQAAITSVLGEIKELKESIRSLQVDLQNDRLAIADSAWDKWAQAHMIPRGRARNDYLRLAMATATDAKCTLMRNLAQRGLTLGSTAGAKTGAVEAARRAKRAITGEDERLAMEAMQDLVSIANMVRIECEGHVELNQYDAAEQSLIQFTDFIHAQQLDAPDTLLSINSYLANEVGGQAVIDQFQELVSSTVAWKREVGTAGVVPQIESMEAAEEDEDVTSEEADENQEA
ncbi:MAG: zinc ribbon domain-containing protein [Bifidobacterium choerinum]